jgi:hypothetical protein
MKTFLRASRRPKPSKEQLIQMKLNLMNLERIINLSRPKEIYFMKKERKVMMMNTMMMRTKGRCFLFGRILMQEAIDSILMSFKQHQKNQIGEKWIRGLKLVEV